MKFYLAATYARNAEMRTYREELAAHRHQVTSRWIDTALEREPIAWGAEKIAANPAGARVFAATDLEDIRKAESVLFFGEGSKGSTSKGGRFVEYGYALALRKTVIIIGPYENVFSSLAGGKYDTWDEFMEGLA